VSGVHQFFADEIDPETGVARLAGGEHLHLKRALRLKTGDEILVSDGDGALFNAVVSEVGSAFTRARLVKRVDWEPESPLEITLLQAVPKGRKMDWVLQKATELGVRRVIPVMSDRSISRIQGERWLRKKARWEQILREAAKQSHRALIPHLGDLLPLTAALPAYRETLNLFFTPRGQATLRECLDNFTGARKMTVVIGPEGGFTPTERAAAAAEGYRSCSMGPRVLRLETAVIKALSVLQFILGDG